jgi:hypothetical protein
MQKIVRGKTVDVMPDFGQTPVQLVVSGLLNAVSQRDPDAYANQGEG